MYNSLTNMHSFLISSKDPQKSLEKAKEILKERGIGKWDLSEITPEKILGIEEVRKFSEKLFFKSRGTEKALVLNLYKDATIEAQNSMLKILEEPPKNTLIIILAENSNQFLPTITSRCKIIELENKEVPKGSGEVFEIFDQNIGERFYLAQTLYEDKEAAVVWLEDQINSLREKAKKEKSVEQTKKFAKTIREFIEARRLIKNTNVNARLTLEHLFLNLD